MYTAGPLGQSWDPRPPRTSRAITLGLLLLLVNKRGGEANERP